MIMEIRTEKLIKAVERRPALYNKSDSNYFCHRKNKANFWTEVCKEVFDGWDDFKPQDKVELAHEVQKRWKSLRTCFAREIAAQKKEKEQQIQHDGLYKRRKRYEYFDMLTFLIEPNEEGNEESGGEDESDDDSGDPLDNVKSEPFHYEVLTEISEPMGFQNSKTSGRFETPSTSQESNHIRSANVAKNEQFENKVLDMLKDIKKDEEDEDRQFMLSLVPSFKKLKDKQKFEARIEILKVLKDISFRDSDD